MTDEQTLVATFSIPGEPISKSRARFTKKGSVTAVYTPEKTRQGELAVAWMFRQASGPWQPNAAAAFKVAATFVSGTRQRRDVDNMLKLVLDALTGVAWVDDSQVFEIIGRKELATPKAARTMVWVYTVGEVPRNQAECEQCGKMFDAYPSQAGKRFCSFPCRNLFIAAPRMRDCEYCGGTFTPAVRGRHQSPARFCSVPCRNSAARVQVQCFTCRVEFTKPLSAVRVINHCSGACAARYQRTKPTRLPKGTCRVCGGPTSRKEYTRCQGCKLSDRKNHGGVALKITGDEL